MKANVKVGLVQIGENFGGQYYLPYSVGLLQAYAQQKFENIGNLEFLLPVYKRAPINESLAYLKDAKLIFFSVYLWNLRYCLEIAKQVKLANSNCITIFGGPQIPDRPEVLEMMLRKYQYIDIGCYTEGEIPFLKILENFHQQAWAEVPSIGFINLNNSFIQTPCTDRISNLDDIPSPYLEDVFVPLMEANPEEHWSVLWETNRGCPFACAFCAWGSNAKKKVYKFGMERLFQEIDWFSKNKIEFIFCCDANFGLFKKRDLEIVEKVAENKNKYGYPVAFSVQSTKNATKTIFKLHQMLNDAELQKGVNLALQSLNEETLKSIKRSNISIGKYQDLQKMFTNDGISTFSDIIVGLPGETYGSFTDGVSSLIEGGQHNRIQFINLSILENTEMAKPEYQREHGLILQECRMVSHHTRLDLNDSNQIYETEHLVVGTKTMPKEDWVRVKVFAWMTSLLHFDKLMQIPFIILNKVCLLSYQELVEIFIIDSDQYPLISGIKSLFTKKALSIQSGDYGFIPSREDLNICWTADEFALIKLYREASISQFYAEAERVIIQHLAESGLSLPTKLLHEAVNLNAQLIKKPFVSENEEICLGYNLIEVYRSALVGLNMPLLEGTYRYEIIRDSQSFKIWDDWCREVVWYGNKTGSYLYSCMAK